MTKMILLMLLLCSISYAATIQGTVTDRLTQEHLIGASVILQETSLGAVTDINGGYCLKNIPTGKYKFQVRYIGYQSISDTVEITDFSQIINRNFVLTDGIQINELKARLLSAEKLKTYTDYQDSLAKFSKMKDFVTLRIINISCENCELSADLEFTNHSPLVVYLIKNAPIEVISASITMNGKTIPAPVVVLCGTGLDRPLDTTNLLPIPPGKSIEYPRSSLLPDCRDLPNGKLDIKISYEFKPPGQILMYYKATLNILTPYLLGFQGLLNSENTWHLTNTCADPNSRWAKPPK